MKVFISWSGELSHQVAEVLGAWIPDVLQGTETWISSEDIEKGSLWFGAINEQLAQTSFGILCITTDNVGAPWILFEAGALAKGLTKARVCPLLINLAPSNLVPPLSMFNCTVPKKADVLKLLKAISGQEGEKGLSPERVEKAFDKWWPEFEGKFAQCVKEYKPKKEQVERNPDQIMQEVLETVRSIQRTQLTQGSAWSSLFVDPRQIRPAPSEFRRLTTRIAFNMGRAVPDDLVDRLIAIGEKHGIPPTSLVMNFGLAVPEIQIVRTYYSPKEALLNDLRDVGLEVRGVTYE